MNERGLKARILLCVVLLAAGFSGLGTRLAFLHLAPHDDVRVRIDRRQQIEIDIPALRGRIYDRNGERNILALDVAVKDICANPEMVAAYNTIPDLSGNLARLIDVSEDTLQSRLGNTGRKFVYLRRFADTDMAETVAARKIKGVFTKDAFLRHYPVGSFMCHIVGFVNYENVGSSGIEQVMDSYLKGTDGYMETKVDARRRELYWERSKYVPSIAGCNVFLTVDQNAQYVVEMALDEAMAEHSAVGAWAVVQRVRTGEIIAMASRPSFDLNDFRNSAETERLNRAIGYIYEPGSTFKIITLAAVLDEGVVAPDTRFNCENGAWKYGGRILKDYHPYGVLTLREGIRKSSNILAAKAVLLMEESQFHRRLKRFGIGERTGIKLPGEEGGILHPVSRWSRISATRMAIGQEVGVTALQMVCAVSAIANDGILMKPYIVSSIRKADGTEVYRGGPQESGRVVSSHTAAIMRDMLAGVTEDGGTGTRARVDGFRVAGKTGTAQKAVAGGYSDTDYVASFAGFLPAEDPELAIIVVIDTPQPLHTGGVVAAPVFRKIATQVVRCLGIQPVRLDIVRNVVTTGGLADMGH